MALIYCVEDDLGIRELVLCALGTAGHEAKGFENADQFFAAVGERRPQMAILDIMLPDTDGITILKKLKGNRATDDIAVVMLTAKTSEPDKVAGLELGADDYIAKPFGVLEFLARVKAVLRRTGKKGEGDGNVLSCGELTLDGDKREVWYGSQEISLTYKEFELLRYLLSNQGFVLSRDQITERIWGFDFEGESRTVDMHIKAVRQKLDEAGCPSIIKTVRGVGYKLEG